VKESALTAAIEELKEATEHSVGVQSAVAHILRGVAGRLAVLADRPDDVRALSREIGRHADDLRFRAVSGEIRRRNAQPFTLYETFHRRPT